MWIQPRSPQPLHSCFHLCPSEQVRAEASGEYVGLAGGPAQQQVHCYEGSSPCAVWVVPAHEKHKALGLFSGPFLIYRNPAELFQANWSHPPPCMCMGLASSHAAPSPSCPLCPARRESMHPAPLLGSARASVKPI